MFTSRSQAWKTCFCTIPEGVCAIELESVWSNAGAGCARGTAECDSTVFSDVPAAAAFCIHLRARDGRKRLYASGVQEPAAAGDRGDQHDVYGNLGGGDAAD